MRLSASSRGLRAHVGPRGARVHVGGGRSGMSTGAGAFTYYSSFSGGSRTRTSSGRDGGPTKAQLAEAEKERQFHELHRALAAIVDVHRAEFPPARPVVIPASKPPDEKSILRRREGDALAGISIFRRSARKEARLRAAALAAQDVEAEAQRLADEHRVAQAAADEAWARLVANDSDTVIGTVDAAFEDNKAPAAPVDVEGSTLSLVMLAPSSGAIPERIPDVTPAGKPTTKKMTKGIRAEAYLTLICGHLLATIKEALAVAPGITHVKAVVVRHLDPDVFGDVRMEALIAATFARSDLGRVQWQKASSPEIVQQAADELLWQLKGRLPELRPLDLDEEPDLKRFVEAVDATVRQPAS